MKYLRRLIWYISSRLLVLCCVLGLMTTVFYFAMNATNIYIVLKDGMAKRAQVVMQGEEAELDKYFAPAYLERDSLLAAARNGQSVYQNYYNITGFDHRISLDYHELVLVLALGGYRPGHRHRAHSRHRRQNEKRREGCGRDGGGDGQRSPLAIHPVFRAADPGKRAMAHQKYVGRPGDRR